MENLINKVGDIAKHVDNFHQSSSEKDKFLNERHIVDMNSDNWLSKSIRPMTLLILLAIQIVIIILSAYGKVIPDTIILQHGTLLFGAFSLYFHSKKSERVAQKNAEANIKIELLKTKAEIRQQRKQNRRR